MNGRFAFGKMLPGRYYVTVSSQASGSYVGTEVAGRSTVYNGWGQGYNVDHTRDVERNFRTELFIEQYVDIKPGDDVVELELRLTAQ